MQRNSNTNYRRSWRRSDRQTGERTFVLELELLPKLNAFTPSLNLLEPGQRMA